MSETIKTQGMTSPPLDSKQLSFLKSFCRILIHKSLRGSLWLGVQLIIFMPWFIQKYIGYGIGYLMYCLMPSRRHIAYTNIELCFPEMSKQKVSKVTREHFRSLGLGIIEVILAWWGSDKKIRKRSKITGIEHVKEALSHGNGALISGGHFTTLEIAGRIIALNLKVSTTFNREESAWWDKTMCSRRERYFSEVVPMKKIRQVLRCLKRNEPVCYLPDQDHNERHHVFAPFFSQSVATTTGPSWFSEKSGAPMLPTKIYRRKDNSGWEVHIHPPIADFPSDDPLQDATKFNSYIEDHIKSHIDQYLWVHRRLKTQPQGQGQSSVYKA